MTELQDTLIRAAALCTALGVLWRWCGAPIRRLLKQVEAMQRDLSDLMWDRLAGGHETLMRRGWADPGEKQRLCEIQRRYEASGRDHLAAGYTKDILSLPEHPPKAAKQC